MKILCLWETHHNHPLNDGPDITFIHTIEELVTLLEYGEGLEYYDKFLINVSLNAATVVHRDGKVVEYNEPYNGIDVFGQNIEKWQLDKKQIAFIGSDITTMKRYLDLYPCLNGTSIIDTCSTKYCKELKSFTDPDYQRTLNP